MESPGLAFQLCAPPLASIQGQLKDGDAHKSRAPGPPATRLGEGSAYGWEKGPLPLVPQCDALELTLRLESKPRFLSGPGILITLMATLGDWDHYQLYR